MTQRSPHTMAVCPTCGNPTVNTEVETGRCWSCALPEPGSFLAWMHERAMESGRSQHV